MSRSGVVLMLKLGVHWGTNGNGLDECVRADSTSVKLCDAFPDIAVPANTLIIGRVVREAGFTPNVGNPRQAAIDYVHASLHDAIMRNQHIQAWEALNEPVWNWDDPDSSHRMLWYSEFLAQCAREIVWRGKKAIIGNWSTGCPPIYDLWYAAKSMLEVTEEFPGRVFIGRHAYGPLWRKDKDGNLEPDTEQAFRYRSDQKRFSEMGFPNVKFYLTECGLDRTGNEQIGFLRAWRSQKPENDYWKKIGIDFEYSNFDDYWRYWISPFEREIRKDDRVVGANLFTLGLRGWDDFQLPGLELARRMQTLSNELGGIEKDIKMTVQIVNVPIPIPVNAQFNFAPLAKVIIDASNDLNQHGKVGTYIPFGQPVPPVPGLTWPNLTALNQDIINHVTVRGALLPLSAIPTAILSEMTSPPENRQKTYGSLNSKLPLEQWKLSPTDFDKVVIAFKAAGIL